MNSFIKSIGHCQGLVRFVQCLWILIMIGQANAITTTYNGVSVHWEAGLTDLVLVRTFDNNLYYETRQLGPKGDSLAISITLPAPYVQQNAFPTLILWSKAGGKAPYGIVKQVKASAPGQDLPFEPYDLTLAPETDTWVDYTYSGGSFEAFSFMVAAYPSSSDFTQSVTFFVHVSLDSSLRQDLAFLIRQLGNELDNIFTEFDGDSCSIGFPTHTVNTSNLNLVVQDTDFAVKGKGPPLHSTRTWNAVPSIKGMFGNGWSFPYESTISRSCGGARIASGSGQQLTYLLNLCSDSPLTYPVDAKSPTGNFDQLTYHSGDYWLLKRAKSHEVWRYDLAKGADYRLTAIADANGNTLTIVYQASGVIDRIVDASGRSLIFSYDSNLRPVLMVAPGNLQASFVYDTKGNLIRTVDLYGTEIGYEYDSENYMTAMSYAGKTFRFAYDTSGGWKHIATVTDAQGHTRNYEGFRGSPEMSYTNPGSKITDALGAITTYTKDSEGRTMAVRSPSGYVTRNEYRNGLLSTIVDPNNNYHQFEYDLRGNMIKQTDPLGNAVLYTFDADDNLLTITNALGQTWTNAYDDKHNLLSTTTPSGSVTTMDYDAKGQLAKRTDANGHSTAFEYDDFGNAIRIIDATGNAKSYDFGSFGLDPIAVTDPKGQTRQYSYDQNRRLVQLTHPDGSVRMNAYDGCARIGWTDENGNKTSIARDMMLREIEVTDPLGAVTKKSYDSNGNRLSTTNPMGRTYTASFDPENYLYSQTDPLGNVVTYGRDANGNLLGLRDEKNHITKFEYDGNNRIVASTDPLNRAVRYTRDALGRIVRTINSRGGVIDDTYDSDGRLSSRTFDGKTFTFGYDKVGQLISFTDLGGTTQYQFDARNKPVSVAYPEGLGVSLGYDKSGNLTSVSYPNGVNINYTYTNRDWIQSIRWGTHEVSFNYDKVGNMLSESRSNGVMSTYVFDANQKVNAATHTRAAIVLASYQYQRDLAGKTVLESNSSPVATSFASALHTADFDPANGITQFNGDTYSYDLDGNLNAVAGTTVFTASYDQMNRLVQMNIDGIQSSFGYDALGNRVLARRGSTVSRYYFDQAGKLLFEADESGTVQRYFFYHGSRLVATLDRTGASYFFHYDKNGSTIALSDSMGNVVNAYAYTPYGTLSGATESVDNRFKYVGGYGVMEEGDGIYFMRNRYFSSKTGRFLQRDPIGLAAGQSNLYAYVGGNPVDHIDPSGFLRDDFYDPRVVRPGPSAGQALSGLRDSLIDSAVGKFIMKAKELVSLPNMPGSNQVNAVDAIRDSQWLELAKIMVVAAAGTAGAVFEFWEYNRPLDPNATEGSGDWICNMENQPGGFRAP